MYKKKKAGKKNRVPSTHQSNLLFQHAKAREVKRKEAEKIRREEEQQEEVAKMLHNGTMIAYPAEKGFSVIRN